MNTQVALYFVSNVLATLIVGGKFATKNEKGFKTFGVALIIDALAFALWTVGYLNQTILLVMVTAGAIALLVSFLFFFRASLHEVSSQTRMGLTILGVVALLAIFIVGRYSPNYAFISPEGFLFFNLTPFVQMLYIFALILAAVPAMNFVASKFNGRYSALVRYGFLVQVAGGVMLITSTDVNTLYAAGWIIGIVNLILWVTLLFSKKAWQGIN